MRWRVGRRALGPWAGGVAGVLAGAGVLALQTLVSREKEGMRRSCWVAKRALLLPSAFRVWGSG